MAQFLYSFTSYLLNLYYMRGTVPGTEETMINKRDQVHTHGLMGKEAENKEADKKK